MKLLCLIAFLGVALTYAESESSVQFRGSNYDLVMNMLPVYGSTKLRTFLTPRALGKIQVNKV